MNSGNGIESITSWSAHCPGISKISPLPGWCFVVMDPEQSAEKYGLIIPETARCRNVLGTIGTVVAESAIVRPAHMATLRGTVGRKIMLASWAGQRFMWGGVDLVKYPLSLSCFVAVLYEGKWIPLSSPGGGRSLPDETGVRRCRYCRSKGAGNILLDGDGICPVCRREETGRKHIPVRNYMTDGSVVNTARPLPVAPELDAKIEERRL